MGRQIVKQPNGLYAVFSSVVDHFVLYDATADELIEFFQVEEAERLAKQTRETIAALEAGEKPYHQFTKSWDEAIDLIRRVHGPDNETLQDVLKAVR